MTQYSDDDLVRRYIELRNFLKAEAERQAEFMKPYAEGMTTIQNMLHQRLLERGAKEGEKAGGRTEHGTFFFKNTLSVKVADREAWLNFVVNAVTTDFAFGTSFLTTHVAKDAVEEYVAIHNAPPPGVAIDTITQVQVRSA